MTSIQRSRGAAGPSDTIELVERHTGVQPSSTPLLPTPSNDLEADGNPRGARFRIRPIARTQGANRHTPVHRVISWLPGRLIQHIALGFTVTFLHSLLLFALALPWIAVVRPEWNALPGWPLPHILAAHATGAAIMGPAAGLIGILCRLLSRSWRDRTRVRLAPRDGPLEWTLFQAAVNALSVLHVGTKIAPQFAPGTGVALPFIAWLGFCTELALVAVGAVLYWSGCWGVAFFEDCLDSRK